MYILEIVMKKRGLMEKKLYFAMNVIIKFLTLSIKGQVKRMDKAFEKILERLEELIEESYYSATEGNRNARIKNRAYHKVKEIVQEVAEEYNGGWIACSERLPKEDGSYLVQSVFEEEVHFYDQYYDSGCEAFGTYRDYYDENTLGFLDSEFVKDECVIAWKPLPEPFKERD